MSKVEVMDLLEANTNERGIMHWNKLGSDGGGLKSCGIGLTNLRKLAKQIGRDPKLAKALWKTKHHEAKVIALLIDDPKAMTREQVEAQVEEVGAGMLAHTFSSCDATLAKSPIAFDVAREWLDSDHHLRRQCAYGLIYELSKNKRNKALTDDFFLGVIKRIEDTIDGEENWTRAGMGGTLIGIGKRNKILNKAAVKLAKKLGPIDYDAGDTACEPIDVLKHLTSDYIKEKLGV